MARRAIGPWYRLAVVVVRPLLTLFTRREWHGAEHLPPTGGFVVCANHISHIDPFTLGHFLYDNGHPPRYLAKESLFRLPLLGRLVRGAGQIPVYRESANALQAYSAAVDAVHRGECVAIYPEGTLTRDPQLWPMRGKTGAARVALATGCPVIPVAQWGAHRILPPYARRLHLLPRHTITVRAGSPVGLDRFAGEPLTGEVLEVATDAIMDALTALLEEIRGEPAPAVRVDPRTSGRPVTGDPGRGEADR